MNLELAFPPGVARNGTELQQRGRWWDSHLIRFHEGAIRPWGGWALMGDTALTGLARAMLAWTDNSPLKWLAIGTHSKLYVTNQSGDPYDITPQRSAPTLAANPFAFTNASAVVTVTHTAHGAADGEYVVFSGASAAAGLTIDGVYQLTYVDANSYTITAASAASATTTGGGAAVVAGYQISPGTADASIGGGYGSGAYGDGDYGGTPGSDPGSVADCTVWSLDTFGQNLVACNNSDGKLYKWGLNTNTPAALIAAAPTACRGLVVTAEGVIFALGADGDPRTVAWCDLRDETNWTAGLPSLAGTFPLQTPGRLMCGRRVRGGTLLFTDVDAHLATFNDPSNPYSFERVGTDCGVISQGAAVAASDGLCAWMGRDGFFAFEGGVRVLACEVSDYVFGDINRAQASKVTTVHSPAYGEVTWFYPSSLSNENDRYVTWSYRSQHWTIGQLDRTCGAPRGVFANPIMCDSSGNLWTHESGTTYTGASQPYLECAPVMLGAGDRVFTALFLIPDENALGGVQATFYSRLLPTQDEETWGPYTAASKTSVLFTARQVRMRLTGASGVDWRAGNFLLSVRPGGSR